MPMKWYDTPYRMLTIGVIFVALFLLTQWPLILLLALFPLMTFVMAAFEQPQLVRHPRAASAHYRAMRHVSRRQTDDAIHWFTRALKHDPTFTLPMVNRGLLYMETAQEALAMADFDAALTLDPNIGDALAVRGRLHDLNGDSQAALRDWERAALNGSILVYTLRGLYYTWHGQHLDALADLREAARLQPQSANAQASAAYMAAMLGDTQDALDYSANALRIDGTFAPAYVARGVAHWMQNNPQAALSDFMKAGELRRDYLPALAGQVAAYHLMDSVREARRVWAYLVTLDARYAESAALIQDIGAAGRYADALRSVVIESSKS